MAGAWSGVTSNHDTIATAGGFSGGTSFATASASTETCLASTDTRSSTRVIRSSATGPVTLHLHLTTGRTRRPADHRTAGPTRALLFQDERDQHVHLVA